MQGVFVNSPLNTYSYTHLKFNVKKIHVDGMGITFTSMASSSWDSADGWICSARYKVRSKPPHAIAILVQAGRQAYNRHASSVLSTHAYRGWCPEA